MKIAKATLSLLVSLLRRIISPFSSGTFSSFDDAIADCSKGYQNQEIVKCKVLANHPFDFIFLYGLRLS